MSSEGPSDPLQPRRKPNWWVRVTVVLAALQAACFLIPQMRPGLLGVILWGVGLEIVPGLAVIVLVIGLIWSVVRRPFWRRPRLVAFAGLVLLSCSGLAFQKYPSSHDYTPSQIRFRLPLDGPILVGWGGSTPEVNYHVVAPNQRWAYDLLVARNGKTSRGEGKNVADFYAYGLPVLAPASGVVRVAYDQDSDRPIGKMEGYKDPSGNHVVLEVASRQFVYLCHLKPGSIKVQPSEKVVEGQELARVGNSGHTSEPHLHIHLQDSSMPELAEGIPLYFHHYRTGSHYVERGIPRGGFAGERFAGEVVENVDAPEPSRPE